MRKFQNKGLELFAMVFSRIPLIFLAVFLWQSLAMLGSTNIAQRAGDLDHMVAHSQDANHHHHADQSLHMDDEDGPVEHLHADTNTNTALLLTAFQLAVIGVASFSPPESRHTVWPAHTLEGPFRPPMARA
jgi:ABC-type nickel/cobalt efflux system permease component RcnA